MIMTFPRTAGRRGRATFAKVVVALGLTMAIAACDDSKSPEAGDTYVLESIDGRPLPFTESDTIFGISLTVNSGSRVLRTDGTYSSTVRGSFSFGPDMTEQFTAVETGTHSMLDGDQIRFIATSVRVNGESDPEFQPDTIVGTLSANVITIIAIEELEPGVTDTTTIVYRKP